MYNTEANMRVAQRVTTNDKRMIHHENMKDNARMSNAKAPPSDNYQAVMKDNIVVGGSLSAGVKKYRKNLIEPETIDIPTDLLSASNVSKGTADRRLGRGQNGGKKTKQALQEGGNEQALYEGEGACSTCRHARKLVPVQEMKASTHGGGVLQKKSNPRALLVKKIMAEKGMSMIEASSYIKKHNLY